MEKDKFKDMGNIDWKQRSEYLANDNIELITDNVSLKLENKELKEQMGLAVDQVDPVKAFSVPDIRNKLSPICHIIALIEDCVEVSTDDLKPAKKCINYLTDRTVYKT